MIGGVALVLSAAPAAPAATVTTTTIDSCLGDVACTKYAAGTPIPVTLISGLPGEANRLTVTREGDSWLIRDEGAPLTGCAPADATAVRCPVTEGEGARIPGLRLTLGDGDDRVVLAGAITTLLDAGAGADEVIGSEASEVIEGGPGADQLDGGGGVGHDILTFQTRAEDITVDLARGSTGEGDTVSGFEWVMGGLGDDTLRGGGGVDVLDGGSGDDRLFGGSGGDSLNGGEGKDVLRGGPGDDALRGADGADRLYGEAGDDALSGDEVGGNDYYRPRAVHGNDLLIGGPGRDGIVDPGGRNTVRSGSGRDIVHMRNGRTDRIDCGGRRDRLRVDRRDLLQRC